MSTYFDSLERRARETGGGVDRTASVTLREAVPKREAVPRPSAPIPAGPYRALRERVLARANGRPIKKIVFAGCRGGEGCTRVAREFAETLAGSGLSILLVDADVRTAGLTIASGASGPDLGQVVSGAGTPAPPQGRLTIVPSPGAGKATERVFHTPQFAEWLEAQAAAYDYVVLDAPPLLEFADGVLLGRLSDGVVIVVQADVTEKDALAHAREQLENAGALVLGAVLNRTHEAIPVLLKPYLSSE
jgi:Mrp family chromosome partitioning ATPase